MADRQKQGGKKGRKIGRAEKRMSHVTYTRTNRRFKNKLKRVRQSSGEAAAQEYTRLHRTIL